MIESIPAFTSAVKPASTHYHVVGAGITGLSVLRYLQKQGHLVSLSDQTQDSQRMASIRKAFPMVPMFFGTIGDESPEGQESVEALLRLPKAETWVVSPGISPSHPKLLEAKARGVRFITDLDLWMEQHQALDLSRRPKVVGITGTNGKSFVALLLKHLASEQGLSSALLGNIGIPVLDMLPNQAPQLVILELSSFQLAWSSSLALDVAVLLNCQNDHLAWHGSAEAYLQAKQNIFKQASAAVMIDDVISSHPPQGFGGRIIHTHANGFAKDSVENPHPLAKAPGTTSYALEGSAYLRQKTDMSGATTTQALASKEAWKVWMPQDALNILIALAILDNLKPQGELGLDKALSTYQAPQHRMSHVGSFAGVDWINNSKATNVSSACASIEALLPSLKGRLFVLLGGELKGQDLTPLLDLINAQDRLGVLLFGQDKAAFEKGLSSEKILLQGEHMEPLVEQLFKQLAAGDMVLLAPACGSKDQYAGYHERGQSFEKLVARYQAFINPSQVSN